MTNSSAAPSMMTPSRRTSAVASAASAAGRLHQRAGRGERGGFGAPASKASRIDGWRAVNGRASRKMSRPGQSPGSSRLPARKAASASRASASSAALAPDRVRAHQRGRGLAERAGLHLLAERGDPALLVEHDVDRRPGCRRPASASRRWPAAARAAADAGSRRRGAGCRDCRARWSSGRYRARVAGRAAQACRQSAPAPSSSTIPSAPPAPRGCGRPRRSRAASWPRRGRRSARRSARRLRPGTRP